MGIYYIVIIFVCVISAVKDSYMVYRSFETTERIPFYRNAVSVTNIRCLAHCIPVTRTVFCTLMTVPVPELVVFGSIASGFA